MGKDSHGPLLSNQQNVGVITAMEGESGNVIGQQRRLRQAKCWISWSLGLALTGGLIVVSVNKSYTHSILMKGNSGVYHHDFLLLIS